MKSTDLVRIAYRQVIRMRVRYRGPLIGMAVGAAALLAVVTLGDLMRNSLGSSIALLGNAVFIKLNIVPKTLDYPEEPRAFNDSDVDLLRRLPEVKSVIPAVYSWWPVELEFEATYRGKEYKHVRIMGVHPDFFTITAFLPLDEGRVINEADNVGSRNVCILGKDVKEWLVGYEQLAVGNDILCAGLRLSVVGVIGDADDPMLAEVVLVPISVARKKIAGMYPLRRITVIPQDIYSVKRVADRVSGYLDKHKPSYKHTVWFDEDRLARIIMILNLFNVFVYLSIFSTLIVSSVAVANVMVSVVRERTPEIGLRRALGASDDDITSQFFLESILVTSFGSVVGILVGTLGILCYRAFVPDSYLAIETYAMALLMCVVAAALSGVLAAFFPTRVAARLDPVGALKYE